MPLTEVRVRSSAEPDRLAFVDALRGWAFLAVLLVHAEIGLSLPTAIQRLGAAANYGVQLFFVISAFTLFRSYESRREVDRRPVLAFLARRAFRIAPMFWLAMLLYVSLDGFGPRGAAPQGLGAAQLASTAAFLHGWHPATINAVVPGGWSIAVEMNFYLLLPVFFLVLSNLRRAALAWALTVAPSVLVSVWVRRWLLHGSPGDDALMGNFTYYWLPRQIPVFLLGFVLFHLDRRGDRGPWWRYERALAGRWVPALAAASVVSIALLGGRVPLAYLVDSTLFVWLAWGLSRNPVRWMVNRVTCHIGKVSYSAYLCHFVVLDGLRPWAMRASQGRGEAVGAGALAILYVVAMACTTALATLTHRLVEESGQRLGKRFIERMEWGRPRAASLRDEPLVQQPARGQSA